MIPTSYRATPRQHEHRRLVRQRGGVQRRLTSVKNRLRRILCDYKSRIAPVCSPWRGLAYLAQVPLSGADPVRRGSKWSKSCTSGGVSCCRRQRPAEGVRRGEAPLCEQEARRTAVADDPRSGLRDHPKLCWPSWQTLIASVRKKRVVAYAGALTGSTRKCGARVGELHLEKNGSDAAAARRWSKPPGGWFQHSLRWRRIYERLKLRACQEGDRRRGPPVVVPVMTDDLEDGPTLLACASNRLKSLTLAGRAQNKARSKALASMTHRRPRPRPWKGVSLKRATPSRRVEWGVSRKSASWRHRRTCSRPLVIPNRWLSVPHRPDHHFKRKIQPLTLPFS